jgi:transposase
MSKICNNCGNILEDDAVFCGNCGTMYTAAPVEAPVEAPVQEEAPAPKKKFNLMTLIIAAAGALTLLILMIALLASGGKKSAVKNYEKVMNGKVNALTKMAPKDYWKYLEDEEDVDIDELKEEFEEMLEGQQERWEDEYGKNVKIKIKMEDSKKMKKKDLKNLAEALADRYEFISKKDVKKAFEVDLEMTIKGRDDEDDSEMEAAVVKIGGKWYLISYSEYEDEVYARFVVDNLVG